VVVVLPAHWARGSRNLTLLHCQVDFDDAPVGAIGLWSASRLDDGEPLMLLCRNAPSVEPEMQGLVSVIGATTGRSRGFAVRFGIGREGELDVLE